MARPFWNGAISFGLVSIPVKMYVATENKSLGFHYLHKKCLTRPKQVLYCEKDKEYITIRDTVSGYEYAKGQYAVFKDEDFEKVPIRTTHTIDIVGFAKSDEIDPIYYYASHYLEPDKLGIKPYALLREALGKTGRVGIAKVSFQRREHLCCLRPMEDILSLHSLHYGNEVRPRGEITGPKTEATKAELDMAVSLVTSMEKHFKPGEYRDEYRDAIETMIEAKIQGKEIAVPEIPPVEMPDLMSALKASIEAAKKGKEKVAVKNK